jgi:hypothetical protein
VKRRAIRGDVGVCDDLGAVARHREDAAGVASVGAGPSSR